MPGTSASTPSPSAGEPHERRRAPARAAAPERPLRHGRRAGAAEHAADGARDRLGPVEGQETDRSGERARDDRGHHRRAGEAGHEPGHQHAERGAHPREHPDGVDRPHPGQSRRRSVSADPVAGTALVAVAHAPSE